MKFYIDGRPADLSGTPVDITIPSPLVQRPAKALRRGSVKLTLPMTPRNMEIVGDAEQANSATLFNAALHRGRLEKDGCTILEGTVRLIETACVGTVAGVASAPDSGAGIAAGGTSPGVLPDGATTVGGSALTELSQQARGMAADGGYYLVQLTGDGAGWIEVLAGRDLSSAPISDSFTLTGDEIRRRWDSEAAIQFFPVQRGSFRVYSGVYSPMTPIAPLTAGNFHPFVSVKALMEAIFRGAGYGVKSDFFASPLFRSLYVSGNFPQSALWQSYKRAMDFRAGCLSDKSAAADGSGVVYTGNRANSIGAIADTADPYQTGSQGARVKGAFNSGDCFSSNGSLSSFVPTAEVTVGFEYKFCYRSAYWLESRARLKCFDTIELGDGNVHRFEAGNSLEDLRGRASLAAGYSYLLVIFDYTHGKFYDLGMTDNQGRIYYQQTSRAGQFSITPEMGEATALDLRIADTPIGPYMPFTGDWAIYEGWVGERGTMNIEVTLRDTPGRYTPWSPKYFDSIRFSGGEAGAQLTLQQNSTLRPVFEGYMAEGSAVSAQTVLAPGTGQLEFVDRVAQMFNLGFRTDNVAQTVRIEPLEGLLDTAAAADWSGAVDKLQPVVVKEAADGSASSLEFRYARGDAAVDEWNNANGTTLGEWALPIHSPAAGVAAKLVAAPAFVPGITALTDLPTAPDAWLLKADSGTSDDLQRNFPMKIVSIQGLAALPEGQYIPWEGQQSYYPLIAFHPGGVAPGQVAFVTEDTGGGPGDGSGAPAGTGTPRGSGIYGNLNAPFTLCFEDRDGMAGLHRFHDRSLERMTGGKSVEVGLFPAPEAIEGMNYVADAPVGSGGDAGGVVELGIDGRPSLFILENIEGYDPDSGRSAKCKFLKY